MIYLDASALVTYVTERANFPALHHFLVGHSGRRRATSTIGFIETVRTAESLGEDLTTLVTYDRRMTTVARSRRLPVTAPGLESWH